MGTVPAATTLRTLEGVQEPAARLGLIAAQYGMQEEAVSLLTQSGRHDLLTHVLQAAGMWDRASDAGSRGHKGALVTGHAVHARHTEAGGDVQGAIKWYTAAQAHR